MIRSESGGLYYGTDFESDDSYISSSEFEGATTPVWRHVKLEAPIPGSKRWRKRRRRIMEGKFQRWYESGDKMVYEHEYISYDTSNGPGYHNDFRARDTGFAETFLFEILLHMPWKQLSSDQRYELSTQSSLASVEMTPCGRPKTNLPRQTPPELFDAILFYLDDKRSHSRFAIAEYSRTLQRARPGEDSADRQDRLSTLKTCSLVCLYWANWCRRSIFRRSTLRIQSSDDVDTILRYGIGGCPSLVPVCELVSRLIVTQAYDTANSFLHRLRCNVLLNEHLRVYRITIIGPIPNHFPRHNLDTPHWSVPPAITTPPSLLQSDTIAVEKVHLPSFKHVAKYVRHFACALRSVVFKNLTWDEESTTTTVPIPRLPSKFLPPDQDIAIHSVRIIAHGCTDNFRLCLTTALGCSDCPLHALPDARRMVSLMTSLWELYPASEVSTDDEESHVFWNSEDLDEQLTRISLCLGIRQLGRLAYYPDFVFLGSRQPRDSATPTLHVVGLHLIFDISEEEGASVQPDALLTLLMDYSELPPICVHFNFDDHEQLKTWIEGHPSAGAVFPAHHIMYALTCKRSKTDEVFPHIPRIGGRKTDEYFRIDPITLGPIGSSWKRLSDLQESLFKECAARVL